MTPARYEVWTVNPKTGWISMRGSYRDRDRALRVAARYRAGKLFAKVCEADPDPNADERRGVA